MKNRPNLLPWSKLTPEAQARFKATCHPTNYPPDFDAPHVTFYEDGRGYRDTQLLAGIFSLPCPTAREPA